MTVTLTLGDCMDALREMPDNAYHLAIVDPPYGGGQSVMQQNHSMANVDDSGNDSTATLKPIRGGSIRQIQARDSRLHEQAGHGRRNTQEVSLTMIYAIGILHQRTSTFTSLCAYRRIKSSGEVTISDCQKTDAFSCGVKLTYRLKASLWHRVNTHGRALIRMLQCLNSAVQAHRKTRAFIQRKSQLNCTNGVYRCLQTKVTGYSIRTLAAALLRSHVTDLGSIATDGKSTRHITRLRLNGSKTSKHKGSCFRRCVA